MPEFSGLAKFIIVMGLLLVLIGAILLLVGKIPFLGRLPGDIYVHKKGFTFYFPLATSILISIILTIILNLFFRR